MYLFYGTFPLYQIGFEQVWGTTSLLLKDFRYPTEIFGVMQMATEMTMFGQILRPLWPRLLTWFNFNPSMDKLSHIQ